MIIMLRVSALAVATAIFSLVVSRDFKVGALALSLTACMCIFAAAVGFLGSAAEVLDSIKGLNSANKRCVELMIKVLAVAYAANFAGDVCTEAGVKSVASAVETFGKLVMLSLALPMLLEIFRSVVGMLK